MTTVIKHKTVNLTNKPKLLISERLHSQINHMHRIVGTLEWSGPLFYSIVSGSLTDPSNLVLRAETVYPKNVGTSGYTEYEFDAGILDYYEKYPEVMGMKLGHLHTHHSMSK